MNPDRRGRVRWVQFNRSSRDEREYEIRRRLNKEGKGDLLDKKVRTSQREITGMAHVVEAADGDPGTFLRLLKQDSDAFDVEPDAVYEGDIQPDEKWGYGFDRDEVEKLREECCEAYEYGRANLTELRPEDADSVVERLGKLCEFFNTAVEIELAPVLYQG